MYEEENRQEVIRVMLIVEKQYETDVRTLLMDENYSVNFNFQKLFEDGQKMKMHSSGAKTEVSKCIL